VDGSIVSQLTSEADFLGANSIEMPSIAGMTASLAAQCVPARLGAMTLRVRGSLWLRAG